MVKLQQKTKKASSAARAGAGPNRKTCLRKNKRGQVRVVGTKGVERHAMTNLMELQQEALNEIVEELLERPDKILVMAKMVKVEGYFKAQEKTSDLWFNHSIMRMDRYPKEDMLNILVEVCGSAGYAIDKIRKADKLEKLQGIVRLFLYLTQISVGDPLPTKYRPLLRASLIERIKELKVPVPRMARDGSGLSWSSNGAQMGVYMLCKVESNRYTVIKHVPSQTEVPVPDDFSATASGPNAWAAWLIERNWGWDTAVLKGKRTSELVIKLFREAMDDEVPWEYTKEKTPLLSCMQRLEAADPQVRAPAMEVEVAPANGLLSAVKNEEAQPPLPTGAALPNL
eukprot:867219-Amphidinium_carterae.1